MDMPVRALMAEAPPTRIDETTRMLLASEKSMNDKCATVPYLTLMISRNVRALGARRLHSIARLANTMICVLLHTAYQKLPAAPYSYATVQEERSVTDQVQDEVTPAAVRPVPRERLATVNSSAFSTLPRRLMISETMTMPPAKSAPRPTTTP